MLKKLFYTTFIISTTILFFSCGNNASKKTKPNQKQDTSVNKSIMEENLEKYVEFELKSEQNFTQKEKQLLNKLLQIAKLMEEIYWIETYGDKDAFFNKIKDEDTKKFAQINFGPWDRLDNNKPFIDSIGEKNKGANFYPKDMTKEEFKDWNNENKANLYTMIRRDKNGQLKSIPYHEFFNKQINKAATLLKEASTLTEDEGFKKYLKLRAEALLTDNYRNSDMAWLDMKNNKFDFVVGPIETYEDALLGNKAAHEAFILVKDMVWSKKLERYTAFLPKLQTLLPVEKKYKAETPGSEGNQLNAYEVLYYAGDCNAGGKTIAINLPNDEIVKEKKGSRKLQLKNSMKAKFDKILLPISNVLIDESQRSNVTFDAFFTNTMFHEVGHGLGLNYTVDNKKRTIRKALQDYYTSLEEGKADILGLYIVDQLYAMGELGEVNILDYYVTFMAGIFRSSRFGASSAHGKANMMRFYFFKEKNAFTRNAENGTYKVNLEEMRKAMRELAEKILIIQGDGDIEKAKKWIAKDGKIKPELQKDLNKINELGIPVDIFFKQGKESMGL